MLFNAAEYHIGTCSSLGVVSRLRGLRGLIRGEFPMSPGYQRRTSTNRNASTCINMYQHVLLGKWKMTKIKHAKSWSNLFGSRMLVAFCSTLTPTWTVKFFRRFIRENLPCRSFWAAILMGHAQVTSCNLSMSDATGSSASKSKCH